MGLGRHVARSIDINPARHFRSSIQIGRRAS
jgi:hypothetical protein